MKLIDVIQTMYGVKTAMKVNPLVSQIQTTKTQILKPNPNRLAWTLINLGSTPVYLAFDESVATTKGIYVSATGGVMGLLFSEDFELVTFPIWGITITAAVDIYYVEVTTV